MSLAEREGAWRPATLGHHEGAERVEAVAFGSGRVMYRYTRDRGQVAGFVALSGVRFLDDDDAPTLPLGTRTRPEDEPPAEHPRPRWHALARRLWPSRTRDVPEARNPERVLLRQLAIVLRRAYLQHFASGEDPQWYHAHGTRILVLGLRGGYTEHRPGKPPRVVRAPYAYTMGADELHRVADPTPDHLSIAVLLGREGAGHRVYVSADGAVRRTWQEHTIVRVADV